MIIEKGHQYQAAIEAHHGGSVSEPVVAGNWFSVAMMLDSTFKGSGRRKLGVIFALPRLVHHRGAACVCFWTMGSM